MSQSQAMTSLMLEALVSRVAATLEMLFPGSEVELRDDPLGRGYGRYRDVQIVLTTNHPRMKGGRYCTMNRIPEEYFAMEGEKFVQHLIRNLPVQHISQMANIACDEAHATRFKKVGHYD
jgi:hypothetical protein